MHEALVSHLYNEASPEERRQVEEHLKSCSVCAEEMTAFERVRGMLQQWQVDELPEVYIVTKDTPPRGGVRCSRC
jgi:anti-sigma factor RsiW